MFENGNIALNIDGMDEPRTLRDAALSPHAWEKEVATNHRFQRLTIKDSAILTDLLAQEKDSDSFLTSPVYYMFTGRNGLWLYQNEGSFILLCWHPNVRGQILVFPPRGKANDDILNRLLDEMPSPVNGIRIARIKVHEERPGWLTGAMGRLDADAYSLIPVTETVLDWQYPARILSTETVSKMQGGHFAKTRSHMRQLEKNHIEVVPFSASLKTQVLDFAFDWAAHKTDNRHEIAELLAPYEEILNLYENGFGLTGLVFLINGKVQAFSMWEPSDGRAEIANAWITLCNTAFNGLSDYVMKTLAERLLNQGVPFLNFGGSETKSLDDFKKKFVPAYSLSLYSVDVEPMAPTKNNIFKITQKTGTA